MSWPLASFLIVGLVLAVGWLAYERRRPSARMAAVVAIMAALAALGRDAFAALPDVKPITAMTLVVGYALGPIPGFTVGALGMLVSNFMLGQGPYTPWQMAAWGMVGLAGAVLGRLSGRRLGRLPLALACAAAALGAKEIMNVYTWTLGASHTPAAFLAVAGQAVAYDVTDTIASFAFGFAFAPELARVLARMRVRMEVIWEEPSTTAAPTAGIPPRTAGIAGSLTAVVVALVIAAALLVAGPGASGARVPSSSAELSFLLGAQNPDGGFGGARGQSSSELYTGWAAMGLAAAGRDPLSVRRAGHTPGDALRGEAAGLQGAGDLERTILALHACGVSVHALPGGDPVARLLRFRAGDGSFGHLTNLTSFAVFALRAAGYTVGDPTVRGAGAWIRRQANGDGGFGFGARGGGSDVDDTAAALQALVDAGIRTGSVVARATGFLLRAQNPDGGYPQQSGGESNAQSTSWAVQGLIAAGRDVRAITREGSRSPLGYLTSLLAANGSIRYSRTGAQTPVWVTAQALTALAGKPLPIAPVRRHASAAGASAAGASAIAPTPAGLPHSRSAARGGSARAPATGAPAAIPAAAARRLNRLARAMGVLAGAVLGPIMR
jgi:energy-coupling factor transport system substrate-specific component